MPIRAKGILSTMRCFFYALDFYPHLNQRRNCFGACRSNAAGCPAFGLAFAIYTNQLKERQMDNLSMDLLRLTRRSRQGARGTQYNRQRGLQAMATELKELGYKLPSARSIKPKHVSALVEKWQSAECAPATIRNRLTWLRWWAEQVNKGSVISKDNADYHVNERNDCSKNRAQPFDKAKFAKLDCKYVQAAIMLQSAFGLRREEAMKFQPQFAIQKNYIRLKSSWTKGGRYREIPITSAHQINVLKAVQTVAGKGSLIPDNLSYKQQLKRYEHQTLKAGWRNTHGLRHDFAQRRYAELTGRPCPFAGGKYWHEMTESERAQDRMARQQISSDLGHARLSIVDIYIGKVRI